MHIQWFPGHMTKALRMMEDNIKAIDCVIYVLDARAIRACFNSKFDKIIGRRPVLYVINKCDMVEHHDLDKWIRYFDSNNLPCIISNSTSNRFAADIIARLISINSELIRRYNDKGVNRSIRAMVVGVPNTGKSTLINSLCKCKRAVTGDKPGVTRGKQWVSIDKRIDLLDTPGTMSPDYENQTLAKHLAYIGSINDKILNVEDLAYELIKDLSESQMSKLVARYGLNKDYDTPLEIMDAIAVNRGLIMKGREIDYERTARVVIDDFRKQRIGKIMLEYPDA